jgi:hypothetical protein
MRREGVPIRLLNAIALPRDESLLCFFTAHDLDQVLEANRRAGAAHADAQEVTTFEPTGPASAPAPLDDEPPQPGTVPAT